MLIANKIDAGEFATTIRKANSLLGTLSIQYAYASLYSNKQSMCSGEDIRACLYVYLHTLELWDDTVDAINYVTEDEFYTIFTKLDSLITSCGICLPTVNVGPNQVLTGVSSTSITAVASSPNGPIVSYLWKVMSGPGAITFSNQTGSQTELNGLVNGSYVIRCTVMDSKGLTAHDDAILTVASAIPHLIYWDVSPDDADLTEAEILAGTSIPFTPGSPSVIIDMGGGGIGFYFFAVRATEADFTLYYESAFVNGTILVPPTNLWRKWGTVASALPVNWTIYMTSYQTEFDVTQNPFTFTK